MPDRDLVIERLRSWLTRTNPGIAGMHIDGQTDIIELRILESLEIVEFILFLEAESGLQILSEALNPADMRTLDSIYERFFVERA